MAEQQSAGRVTGIGGVFFLADEDNQALAKWYQEYLGIRIEAWGGAFSTGEPIWRKTAGRRRGTSRPRIANGSRRRARGS